MPKNDKFVRQCTNSNGLKWVEIKDDTRGTYNTNSLIKLNIKMLKSSLRDYSDGFISKRKVKGTITITGEGANDAAK